MTEEALRAEAVRKVYRSRGGPDVEALRGVSISLRRGGRVALLGRNGAGKTTFLRIASTLLVPTSGTIHAFGFDVVREPERVRGWLATTDIPSERCRQEWTSIPFLIHNWLRRKRTNPYRGLRGYARIC